MVLSDTASRPVPFRIEDPERIPAARYYDPGFFQAEVDYLWPHVWQMACRLEQIPEVGDWIEYRNLGQSVIVVRTGTDREQGVQAFYNACRHRGVAIVGRSGLGFGNCAHVGFVCPFHGWRWNMKGENTLVYGKHLFSDRQLSTTDINLQPCRVESWGGCAYVNFDDDAPSFRDTIGPVAERFDAHRFDTFRAEWWYATELPANWKIAMEAFMEGYHVRTTHPQLFSADSSLYSTLYETPWAQNGFTSPDFKMNCPHATSREAVSACFRQLELLSEGMAGMVHAKELEIARDLLEIELPDNPVDAVVFWENLVRDEIGSRLRSRGEPIPDLNRVRASDRVHAVEFIFPNSFILSKYNSRTVYRIRPSGPESCLFDIWSLTTFPEDQEPDPLMEPVVLPHDSHDFPPIPCQDYANIPSQQAGLHSRSFAYMRLAQDIEGLISNYQRLIDGYLAGVPTSKLAAATHLLANNFDGPIKVFDF